MSEGRTALRGVAMETPAGYGMEMGEEQGKKQTESVGRPKSKGTEALLGFSPLQGSLQH